MAQDGAEIKVTVVEPDHRWDERYTELKSAGLLNIIDRFNSTDEIDDPVSGLVLIDGLHEYAACWNDYVQTQLARFVAFHDIVDSYVQQLPDEGVVGAWKKVKSRNPGKYKEFLNGIVEPLTMGIGLIER